MNSIGSALAGKGKPMRESDEQAALFLWAAYRPELRLMFHIPNGGSRNPIEAANLKRQGVKAGVPDVFLPIARHGCHGLFIEMKRAKGGVLSQFQREYIEALMREGYRVAVCHGFEEAKRTIEEYLDEKVLSDG